MSCCRNWAQVERLNPKYASSISISMSALMNLCIKVVLWTSNSKSHFIAKIKPGFE